MKCLVLFLFLSGCYYYPQYDTHLITKPDLRELKRQESYMNWKNATTREEREMWRLQYIRDRR